MIGHRAGGNAAPENSLAGLRYAIGQRADQVEIDVQRTLDGHYVLNHDDTFQRAAGDGRPSFQLTLDQIKALRLTNGEQVPELEEFLTAAKGRVQVLLELKGGATADSGVPRPGRPGGPCADRGRGPGVA